MRTIYSCFDFKSADLAAEERNYAEVHVGLARQLPGLREYVTGRFVASPGAQPTHYRTAILSFDSVADAEAATRKSPVAKPLAADSREHMTNLRWLEADTDVIVPFDSRPPGHRCLLMAAEFDLHVEQAGFSDAASAEQRYLGEHTRIASKLPGLRYYLVGRLVAAAGREPDRARFALLGFDNAEALREAYRSPAGADLIKDGEATISNARFLRIEATLHI
jgi:uncharacterized protein (TIGR02118 family)